MTMVRLATRSDSTHIAQLMKQGYAPDALDLTIYGCSGIAQFLEMQMTLPYSLRDIHYVIATDGSMVTGFAEFKLAGSAVFLNYICTAPGMRGTGIANTLLGDGMRIVCGKQHRTMQLDVFVDNAGAREWYRRLGFRTVGGTSWWRYPVTEESAMPGQISGFAQAEACHAAYGFSSFQLFTNCATYSIGRLGTAWFKSSDPDLLNDDQAQNSLAALESGRHILALLPADHQAGPTRCATRLHVAERMSVEIDILRRSLTRRESWT